MCELGCLYCPFSTFLEPVFDLRFGRNMERRCSRDGWRISGIVRGTARDLALAACNLLSASANSGTGSKVFGGGSMKTDKIGVSTKLVREDLRESMMACDLDGGGI